MHNIHLPFVSVLLLAMVYLHNHNWWTIKTVAHMTSRLLFLSSVSPPWNDDVMQKCERFIDSEAGRILKTHSWPSYAFPKLVEFTPKIGPLISLDPILKTQFNAKMQKSRRR